MIHTAFILISRKPNCKKINLKILKEINCHLYFFCVYYLPHTIISIYFKVHFDLFLRSTVFFEFSKKQNHYHFPSQKYNAIRRHNFCLSGLRYKYRWISMNITFILGDNFKQQGQVWAKFDQSHDLSKVQSLWLFPPIILQMIVIGQ